MIWQNRSRENSRRFYLISRWTISPYITPLIPGWGIFRLTSCSHQSSFGFWTDTSEFLYIDWVGSWDIQISLQRRMTAQQLRILESFHVINFIKLCHIPIFQGISLWNYKSEFLHFDWIAFCSSLLSVSCDVNQPWKNYGFLCHPTSNWDHNISILELILFLNDTLEFLYMDYVVSWSSLQSLQFGLTPYFEVQHNVKNTRRTRLTSHIDTNSNNISFKWF